MAPPTPTNPRRLLSLEGPSRVPRCLQRGPRRGCSEDRAGLAVGAEERPSVMEPDRPGFGFCVCQSLGSKT